MKKSEDILERLKGQMPQVPDGDLLTESIMQAINATTDNHGRIVPLWMQVIRTVSSVAAVLFIALFIGLNGHKAEPGDRTAMESETALRTSMPVVTDKTDALKAHKEMMERRKLRQSKQTKIENLYAEI